MPANDDQAARNQAAYSLLMDAAMDMKTQSGADAIFAELVTLVRSLRPKLPLNIITQTLREALGYHAGYFDVETRERVERLYRTSHPLFGPLRTCRRPIRWKRGSSGRKTRAASKLVNR
jgi:hypothetical protein